MLADARAPRPGPQEAAEHDHPDEGRQRHRRPNLRRPDARERPVRAASGGTDQDGADQGGCRQARELQRRRRQPGRRRAGRHSPTKLATSESRSRCSRRPGRRGLQAGPRRGVLAGGRDEGVIGWVNRA
ncbi:hypothetical protein PVAP13_1KG112166 [Panicum virgatum]|uniref:Uncharacterized protein n=1 Tax=Panicum virgatum TaxID=38727 RepID=A0A8T0XQP1_PANVG|nr:hypothetical protein PVAP13_1KG112166 [Panicum virgatum]